MKAKKLLPALLMPAIQTLLVLTAAVLTVLAVLYLPKAGRAALLTPWIAAGLIGGGLGGRLLFPRWLRAGAAAAVWQTALTVFGLASAEPRLLAAGTILRLFLTLAAACMAGALFVCGWRGAQKLRRAAAGIAAGDMADRK